MRKYLRSASILIGPPGQEGLAFSSDRFRMAFTVTKTLEQDANRFQASVYGLSRQSQDMVTRLENSVILSAGYQGAEEVIAIGDIETYETIRQPPDVVTSIECGDGIRTLRDSRSNISISDTVSVRRILDRFATDLGVELRETTVDLGEPFENGFSFNGKTKDGLAVLARRGEWGWSIQGGELQISPQRGPALDDVIVVSAATGMINRPERLDELTPQQEDEGWRVSTLLEPDAEPGMLLEIESDIISGMYSIKTVEHAGDTRGQDWTTTMEVSEL